MVRPASNIGRTYLVAATFFLFLLSLAGVYLRARYVYPFLPGLVFKNVLHAHSHVAYSGWASLALIGGVYSILPRYTGRPLVGEGWARVQLWIITVATVTAFFGFGAVGYQPFTIAVGSILDLAWYSHIVLVWLNIRRVPRPRPFAASATALSTAYLFLASLGTLLATAVRGTGGNELLLNAGIYMFLHNFVEGWLIIGLLGLVAAASPELAERLDNRGGRALLWALGLLTAPGFLVWLKPYGLEGPLLSLGLMARGLGLIPYAAVLVLTAQAFRGQAARYGAAFPFLAAAWIFFLARVGMQFMTVAVPQSLAWGQVRHLFIGYLHTDLLGVVSGAFMGLIYLWAVRPGALVRAHLVSWVAGAAAMIVFLLAAGFAQLLMLPGAQGLLLKLAFAASLVLPLSFVAFLHSVVTGRGAAEKAPPAADVVQAPSAADVVPRD